MVAIEIGNVERRGRIDAGQAPQGNQAIVVGLGIIARPAAAEEAKPAAAAVAGSVLEAAPIELGGDVRSAVVFVAVAAPEAPEPSELHREQSEGEEKQEGPDQLHR